MGRAWVGRDAFLRHVRLPSLRESSADRSDREHRTFGPALYSAGRDEKLCDALDRRGGIYRNAG